tara:strand:+ start:736 stop:987 length:252 start_codon:yes stop_codon:yes gene_type:complete
MILNFQNYYTSITEKDDHKKSKEYKKLTPKMKNAVDEIFKLMDTTKGLNILNNFEKTLRNVSKKHRVTERELTSYFEREVLSI